MIVPLNITILYGVCLTIMCVLGGFLLWKKTSVSGDKYYLGFILSSIGWIISLYLGYFFGDNKTLEISTLFFRLAFGIGILALGMLPAFFLSFPSRFKKIPFILFFLHWGVILSLFILSIFTGLIYEAPVIVAPHEHIKDILGSLYGVYALVFLECFVVAMLLGVLHLKKAKGIEKRKLLFALWGLGAFVFTTIITNVVLPLFSLNILQVESPAFSLLFSIPAFYSIIRYRFLDVQITFQKLFSVITQGAFYLVPVVAALVFLSGRDQGIVVLIMMITGVFWGKETAFWFDKMWNHVFFHTSTNKIQDIKRCAGSFQNSFDTGIHNISQILGGGQSRFVFAQEESLKYIPQFFEHHPDEDLVKTEVDYILEREGRKEKSLIDIQGEMEKAMISVAIPVFRDNKLLGAFLLENPIDGQLFSSQEIKATRTVLKNATVYISRKREYNEQVKNPLEKGDVPTDFINNLLHEIRHPLMIAKTTRELIEWKQLHPEDQDALGMSEAALSDLTRKLDSITDAFQWEHGMIPLEKSFIDLESFLEMVQEYFYEDAKQITYAISGESLPKELFSMDVSQLKEAFLELVKNGLFFNNSVIPSVHIDARKDIDGIVFKIKDNGRGIHKDFWKKIFDLLFVVSESRNETECGLGVGATKAAGIIKKHGGSCVVAQSSLQTGTLLRVMLPLQKH